MIRTKWTSNCVGNSELRWCTVTNLNINPHITATLHSFKRGSAANRSAGTVSCVNYANDNVVC